MAPAFLSPLPVMGARGRAFAAALTASRAQGRSLRHAPCRTRCEASNTSPKMADVLERVPTELRSSLLHLPEDAEVADLAARHTKVVATIGPSSCSYEKLLRLAAGGMNLARLNMSHGDFDFHRRVIQSIRKINSISPFVVGVMVDLGSWDSVRIGEFSRNPVLQKGDSFTLTTRHEASYPEGTTEVSSDEFLRVVCVGDALQCEAEGGGQVELVVKNIIGKDVHCTVVIPGQLHSRGTVTIRGKSFNSAPNYATEDINAALARSILGCPPDELQFAYQERVEYIALSFVNSPEQIHAVRRVLQGRRASTGIVAKIESPAAFNNLDAIVEAADAVMIARGDLGASLHYEKVPYWQELIVRACRRHGKPALVSTHFLESMVLYPTPTRAEVTDMTEAVKQRADALVMTAETARGKFPFKALSTMDAVLRRVERRIHEEDSSDALKSVPPLITDPTWWTPQVGDIAENIASSAALLAKQQNARAIFVFTQKGLMATLMSRYRPDVPIYAFTATPTVRNKLTLMYGVRPFRVVFEDDPEETIQSAIRTLKERKVIDVGDLVIVLADVLGGREGSTEAETRPVFNEAAKGGRSITASEVRNALRRLGLKVSDKIEAQLGMREVDVEEVGFEMAVAKEKTSPIDSGITEGMFDYDRFRAFASQAKEIVHTLQMRYID